MPYDDTFNSGHGTVELDGITYLSDSVVGKQYVAHGAAGRAAFGNNDFRRGPVNVAVIRLHRYAIGFPSRVSTKFSDVESSEIDRTGTHYLSEPISAGAVSE